jgi:hypothetical protein
VLSRRMTALEYRMKENNLLPLLIMILSILLDSRKKPIDKLLYISLFRFSHMNLIHPSLGKLMLMLMVGVTSVNTVV